MENFRIKDRTDPNSDWVYPVCSACGKQAPADPTSLPLSELQDPLEGVVSTCCGFRFEIPKKPLPGLFLDHPDTPEGKYLVIGRDGEVKKWPLFVLGGRDPLAVDGLLGYIAGAERMMAVEPERAAKMGLTPAYVEGLRRRVEVFRAYNKMHGDSDPGMGRHRKDDPATVAKMREAQSS